MDLQSKLAMGGYGAFVWSAYGLALLVLVWNYWSARRSEAEAQLSAQRRNENSRENRS